MTNLRKAKRRKRLNAVERNLNWLGNEMHALWERQFELMRQIGKIKRAAGKLRYTR